MLSIRGVYTGNQIKALENIPFQANVQVIITFLDEEQLETSQQQKTNYDFSNVVGKLEWQGDALQEQRKIRDEW